MTTLKNTQTGDNYIQCILPEKIYGIIEEVTGVCSMQMYNQLKGYQYREMFYPEIPMEVHVHVTETKPRYIIVNDIKCNNLKVATALIKEKLLEGGN